MSFYSDWELYLDIVSDLIETESVSRLQKIPHHLEVSCFEHSVFVSFLSFRIAKLYNLDYAAAARGGLLHDLYLYNSNDKTQYDGIHLLRHSRTALENACKLGELSEKEKNIIRSHMWPLSLKMPKCREAVIVNLVDKYCATLEATGIWNRMKMRDYVSWYLSAAT